MSTDLNIYERDVAGQMVISVSIGLYMTRIELEFAEISVEAGWALRNASGELIDESVPSDRRTAWNLWRLLGTTLTSTGNPMDGGLPRLDLRFDNGLDFFCRANYDGLEDWNVHGRTYNVIVNGDIVTVFSSR